MIRTTKRSPLHRMLSVFTALASTAVMLPQLPNLAAEAAVSQYALQIAGVQVTSANQQDILGDGLFVYRPEDQHLFVQGSYTTEEEFLINSSIAGLTVVFDTDSVLRSERNCLRLAGDTTIIGRKKATLIADQCAIFSPGSTLTIKDMNLDATGTYAIAGNPSNDKLIISNSTVHARSNSSLSTAAAVCDFANGIELDNCSITMPVGAEIKNGSIYESGGSRYAKNVTFSAEKPYIEYGIALNGEAVSSFNNTDILGNGLFSYDIGSKTLRIGGDFETLSSEMPSLTIDIAADAYNNADEICDHSIALYANTTITGSGKLTMTKNSCLAFGGDNDSPIWYEDYWDGIYVGPNATLTLQDADIAIDGQYCNHGIFGAEDLTSHLSIIHSKLSVKATEGAVCRFAETNGIVLDNSTHYAPENVYIDYPKADAPDYSSASCHGQSMYISDTGSSESTRLASDILVVPGRSYDIWIAGQHVFDYNSADILGNGKFSFSSNTLTIKGNYSSDLPVIQSKHGMTINAASDSVLTSAADVMQLEGNYTITGSGKLTVNSTGGNGIFCTGTLNIRNASIEAKGKNGICGHSAYSGGVFTPSDTNNKLTVINSDVHAQGSAYAFTDFYRITLTNSTLTSPAKAVNANGRVYHRDGTTLASDAVISQGNYPAIIEEPQNASVAVGDTALFTVTATGTGLIYQWQHYDAVNRKWVNVSMEGAKTATMSVPVTEALEGEKYHCVVKNSENHKVISETAALTVLPKITAQPKSVSSALDEKVTFTVAANGTGLTYQWQYFNTQANKWENTALSGNKTATLNVKAFAGRNGMQYHCIVKNALEHSVVSAPATLKIVPVITAQPQDASGYIDDAVQFSVTATGISLTYQWQRFNTSSGKWENTTLTGNKTPTLNVPVIADRNGMKFKCIIKDSNNTTLYTSAATLTVLSQIKTQPQDCKAALNSEAKFSIEATGSGLIYQWQYYNTTAKKWMNTTESTAQSSILKVMTTEETNGRKYKCIVKDANGIKLFSSVVTLIVIPVIQTQPQDYQQFLNRTARFSIEATGTGLIYQWQYYDTAAKKWMNVTESTAQSSSLKVMTTEELNGRKYKCIVKDANGTKLHSSTATLTVLSQIKTQPQDCQTVLNSEANFSINATGAGLIYQWQYYDTAAKKWMNVTESTAQSSTLKVKATEETNGRKYKCIVKDANGTKLISSVVTLTVVPIIQTQPQDCQTFLNSEANFSIEATGIDLIYQWQYYNSAAKKWMNVTESTAQSSTLKVKATEETNGRKYHCIVKDANGTMLYSSTVTLTVLSQIKTQPQDCQIGLNSLATFSIEATGVGLIYQWQYYNTSSNKWMNTTEISAQSSTLEVKATEETNGRKYHCIVRDANGTRLTSSSATLTIVPVIQTQPQSVETTINTEVQFRVVASGIGLSYRWQYCKPGEEEWHNSGLPDSNTNTLKITAFPKYNGWKYRCIVTDSAGHSVTSNKATLTIK